MLKIISDNILAKDGKVDKTIVGILQGKVTDFLKTRKDTNVVWLQSSSEYGTTLTAVVTYSEEK